MVRWPYGHKWPNMAKMAIWPSDRAVQSAECTMERDSTQCGAQWTRTVQSAQWTVHRGEAIAARGNYHQAADRAPHQPSGDHHDDFDHRDDYDHLDHFDHCVNFDHCDDFDHHDDFDGVRRI